MTLKAFADQVVSDDPEDESQDESRIGTTAMSYKAVNFHTIVIGVMPLTKMNALSWVTLARMLGMTNSIHMRSQGRQASQSGKTSSATSSIPVGTLSTTTRFTFWWIPDLCACMTSKTPPFLIGRQRLLGGKVGFQMRGPRNERTESPLLPSLQSNGSAQRAPYVGWHLCPCSTRSGLPWHPFHLVG